MFEELNTEITCPEIDKSLLQLKTSKSGGPDLILNECLIHGKHNTDSILLQVI